MARKKDKKTQKDKKTAERQEDAVRAGRPGRG